MNTFLVDEEPRCIYHINRRIYERKQYEESKGEDKNFCIDYCTLKCSYLQSLQSFYLTMLIHIFNSRILILQKPSIFIIAVCN